MKIQEVLSAYQIITQLASQRVSPQLAYGLLKNMKRMESVLETFDRARVEGLKNMGFTLNEEKDQYIVPEEKREEWQKQYQELVNMDADFAPYRISLDVAQRDGIKLSAIDMNLISWMFADMHDATNILTPPPEK